jgi:hypothetical protein
MPKKFRGKSTAGAKAKEQKRQSAQAKERVAREKKERMEAAKWEVGANIKGERRQREEEEKRLAKQQKQESKKLMLAEEEEALSKMKAPKGKLRKAQLKNRKPDFAHLNAAAKKNKKKTFGVKSKKKKKKKVVAQRALEPNLNRQRANELENGNATGIDAALNLMSLTQSGEPDRHPERRAKAAFRAFEEREMPLMREDNPGLKRSQLKELIFKKWKKSPENPFNQRHVAYNSRE